MTVDLKTGGQYAPRREDHITKIAAAKPGGECPAWRAFLDRVTDGDQDLQDYLQRIAGYCLTGYTHEHVMFFLHGNGANGKSVFVNSLAGMMGDYAITAPMEIFIDSRGDRHPTELAMLRGARLVVATETQAGRRWNEARIKALTAGEPIAARFMRGDFFEFIPQFKLMIAGNHRPHLRNVDEAIRRRLHLIPFTVTIPPEDRDTKLAEKLKAEWGGILQWAIDGCLEWQRMGLAPPEAVTKATDEYVSGEDIIKAWLDDRCYQERTARTLASALYKSFKEWAEATGERPGTQRAFSMALESHGYRKEKTMDGRYFHGLRL